jgi:hypothetical protein
VAARRKSEFWRGVARFRRGPARRGRSFSPCQGAKVLFLFYSKNMEGQMSGIDREGMIVLAFGWLVALAVTLS